MHEMARAQRFVQAMAWFWTVITYLILMLSTAMAVTARADLRRWPGAAVVGGAVALYAVWYSAGYRWLVGPARSWQCEHQGRRIVNWLVLEACALLLLRIDPTFALLQWVAFGMALSLQALPWSILCVAPPALLLLASWGIWPGTSMASWLTFAGALLTFAIYTAVVYLPAILLRQRFTQARLYRDLEAAHADLAQAHAQLAASAEGERELAVLRERARLARDLHDTLGHALVLATVKLEATRRLMAGDPDRADHELVATQGVLREALHELRSTLETLRDPTPECLPVAQALARQAQAAGQRAGFAVQLHLCDTTAQWPAEVQAALLRIGGEAIANVERHAHARHVALTVMGENDAACLIITDDGSGLPDLPTDATGGVTSPTGHFGLAGMRERAAELAGTCAITSAPNQGTRIVVTLPLAATVPSQV